MNQNGYIIYKLPIQSTGKYVNIHKPKDYESDIEVILVKVTKMHEILNHKTVEEKFYCVIQVDYDDDIIPYALFKYFLAFLFPHPRTIVFDPTLCGDFEKGNRYGFFELANTFKIFTTAIRANDIEFFQFKNLNFVPICNYY